MTGEITMESYDKLVAIIFVCFALMMIAMFAFSGGEDHTYYKVKACEKIHSEALKVDCIKSVKK